FAKMLALPALLSLACVLGVLLVAFRRELAAPMRAPDTPEPPLDRTLAVLCVLALAFVITRFFTGHSLAWTAMIGAGLLLVASRVPPTEMFAQVDGTLLLFFAGLFVVTHGVAQAGVTERIHDALAPLFGADATHQTFRFGLFTVLACQVVSNVPF